MIGIIIVMFILIMLNAWVTSYSPYFKIRKFSQKLLYQILYNDEYQDIEKIKYKWDSELRKNLGEKRYKKFTKEID